MTQDTSRLQISERQNGDIIVLTLTGDMLIDDGDLLYGRKINELVGKGHTKFILDLSGVMHIDSSGVGMMVAKVKTVRDRHGDIRLVRLTNRTQHLFGMMKLALVFETFEDEAAAMRSFSVRPEA